MSGRERLTVCAILSMQDIRPMDAELNQIVEIMEQVHGLHVAVYDPSFLKTSVDKRRLRQPLETLRAYGK
jgi:hypothetical protein